MRRARAATSAGLVIMAQAGGQVDWLGGLLRLGVGVRFARPRSLAAASRWTRQTRARARASLRVWGEHELRQRLARQVLGRWLCSSHIGAGVLPAWPTREDGLDLDSPTTCAGANCRRSGSAVARCAVTACCPRSGLDSISQHADRGRCASWLPAARCRARLHHTAARGVSNVRPRIVAATTQWHVGRGRSATGLSRADQPSSAAIDFVLEDRIGCAT